VPVMQEPIAFHSWKRNVGGDGSSLVLSRDLSRPDAIAGSLSKYFPSKWLTRDVQM
jgi:hypothetical protein